MEESFLNEKQRAEDVILGSLGFGEEAKIIQISSTQDGFTGVGRWLDGEEFEFESDDELSDLELWALKIVSESIISENAAADSGEEPELSRSERLAS